MCTSEPDTLRNHNRLGGLIRYLSQCACTDTWTTWMPFDYHLTVKNWDYQQNVGASTSGTAWGPKLNGSISSPQVLATT